VIGLLQRVTHASVAVDGHEIARIARGLLVLVGVERGDTAGGAQRLAERLVGYRVFADDAGRMNRSVRDVDGALLLVPQFTLAADTDSGMRPSFSSAAAAEGERLFQLFVECAAQAVRVRTGRFGADMKVSLVNEGPVTFRLRVAPPSKS
jgi:D-tyrosyl-tRNA(Tyr) deacylase